MIKSCSSHRDARSIQIFPRLLLQSFRQLSVAQREQLLRRLAAQTSYRAKELADSLGMSLRHLQRYFEADFGLSPQAWLNELRMRSAYELLQKEEQVKGVAYALGFKQVSHFSREFKRVYGVQPSRLCGSARESSNPLIPLPTRRMELILMELLNLYGEWMDLDNVQSVPVIPIRRVFRFLVSRKSGIAKESRPDVWKRLGHKVDWANDDNDALQRARNLTYDLIFLEARGHQLEPVMTNRNTN